MPNIDKLGDDCNVSLAVSLHAPNDKLRNEIVPINKLHPIAELLDACWRYAAKHANRFITFEYVMLRGVNDSKRHADELASLLKHKPAKVNLIPFNPFPGTAYSRSSAQKRSGFSRTACETGVSSQRHAARAVTTSTQRADNWRAR